MTWSIVLATRNGADTLPLSLAALARIEPPENRVEIIIVDNASSDRTSDILRSFSEEHGALRIEEPRRGKSHALNTALERASGDMLVFMDDDVLPSSGWLRAFEAAIHRFPEAGVFAGQVRPHWLAPPPPWLDYLTSRGSACGCTDVRARPGRYPASHVKGANFAVRRSALRELRFDTGDVNFGANGDGAGGEDTGLVSVLERKGTSIVYVPEAIAGHIVNADEMSLRTVVRRLMRIGRSSAALSGRSPLAVAASAVKVVVFGILALVQLGLLRKNEAALHMSKLVMNMGRLDYHLRGLRPRTRGVLSNHSR